MVLETEISYAAIKKEYKMQRKIQLRSRHEKIILLTLLQYFDVVLLCIYIYIPK